MIGKIDSYPSNKLRASVLPGSVSGTDFGSVLNTCLQNWKADLSALDQARLHLLGRALDAMLSEGSSEDSGVFQLSPILSLASVSGLESPYENPAVSNKPQATSQNFEPVVEEAATKHGVDPKLVKAVIAAESGGNSRAVSPAGAQGLMQLMPSTAAELGVKDPFDPVQNIMAGTRYLRQLVDRYHGNTRLALAAYNWGMGNLEKRPESLPRETRAYIARVEKTYNSLA